MWLKVYDDPSTTPAVTGTEVDSPTLDLLKLGTYTAGSTATRVGSSRPSSVLLRSACFRQRAIGRREPSARATVDGSGTGVRM